jgi:hypothetical protein
LLIAPAATGSIAHRETIRHGAAEYRSDCRALDAAAKGKSFIIAKAEIEKPVLRRRVRSFLDHKQTEQFRSPED